MASIEPGPSKASKVSKAKAYSSIQDEESKGVEQVAENTAAYPISINGRLKFLPRVRPLALCDPSKTLNLDVKATITAVLGQIRGDISSPICDNCASGTTKFRQCVIVPGHLMGACCNCFASGLGAKCSFRLDKPLSKSTLKPTTTATMSSSHQRGDLQFGGGALRETGHSSNDVHSVENTPASLQTGAEDVASIPDQMQSSADTQSIETAEASSQVFNLTIEPTGQFTTGSLGSGQFATPIIPKKRQFEVEATDPSASSGQAGDTVTPQDQIRHLERQIRQLKQVNRKQMSDHQAELTDELREKDKVIKSLIKTSVSIQTTVTTRYRKVSNGFNALSGTLPEVHDQVERLASYARNTHQVVSKLVQDGEQASLDELEDEEKDQLAAMWRSVKAKEEEAARAASANARR